MRQKLYKTVSIALVGIFAMVFCGGCKVGSLLKEVAPLVVTGVAASLLDGGTQTAQ